MSVHDTLLTLRETVNARMADLWARHDAGDLSWEEFVEVAVGLIASYSSKAAGLGDLAMVTELARLRERILPTAGVVPEADVEDQARRAIEEQRGTQSFALEPATAVGIAATSVVLAQFQHAQLETARRSGVARVKRGAEPSACPVCSDLDGNTQTPDARFWSHKGCACILTPSTTNPQE